MFAITYLSIHPLHNTDVLLRVDFNVSLNPNHTIANDERIRQALPTIRYLLHQKNRVVIISHLGRPEKRDPNLSLKNVGNDLQKLLPEYDILFVSNIEEAAKILIAEYLNQDSQNRKHGVIFSGIGPIQTNYATDLMGTTGNIDADVLLMDYTKFLMDYIG